LTFFARHNQRLYQKGLLSRLKRYRALKKTARDLYKEKLKEDPAYRYGRFARDFHGIVAEDPRAYNFSADTVPTVDTIAGYLKDLAPAEVKKRGRPPKGRASKK
jgi:hypothetical protein